MAKGGLTDLQIAVLAAFFALPESDGFVLAGGAGLVAAGLSTRPTEDVDLFSAAASIEPAGDALEESLNRRGWSVERIEASKTFRRILVTTESGDRVLVDLARDAAPIGAVIITAVGPIYPPDELAARKVLALFDRAALRDFLDVAHLSEQFDREGLLRLAREIDPGFDRMVFSEMLDTLGRFTDDDIRPADPIALRAFFQDWALDMRRVAGGSD